MTRGRGEDTARAMVGMTGQRTAHVWAPGERQRRGNGINYLMLFKSLTLDQSSNCMLIFNACEKSMQ